MTGKTHTAAGVAAALMVTNPGNVRDLALCSAVAAIGAVICDVDASRSESHQTLEKTVGIMTGAFLLLAAVEWKWHLGIMSYIKRYSSVWQVASGILMLIGICVLGSGTPHRSFMHSIAGMACIGAVTYYILPVAVWPAMTAMASHILLDTLNHRKVRIFYPLRSGMALGLCKSDGLINQMIFWIASGLIVIRIIVFVLINGKLLEAAAGLL